MEEAVSPDYVAYLYKDHADHYTVQLDAPSDGEQLKAEAAPAEVRRQWPSRSSACPFDRMDLIVPR